MNGGEDDAPPALPPPRTPDGLASFYAPDRATWRQWLAAHHATAPGVWLIYYKKGSGQPRVAYADAVEEALCFGWIDSRPNAIDDARSMQLFSPRKLGSPWSRLNKERAARLMRDGLMTEAGRVKIEAAQRDGSWNMYDAIEELTVPDDLRDAFAANPAAETYFAAFSPSVRKSILWWIESAKRPATREKRVAETVARAAENRKANQYR